MKKSGILMPVASLPSPYYVGDFGPVAYRFADMIRDAGFNIWQMLPLNPLGYGNSPYQCYSSKALDEIYVSPELLYEDGLIDSLPEKVSTDTVDYQKAKELKRGLLRQAYEYYVRNADYYEFLAQEWVYKYAVFITLKEANGNQCWNTWPDEMKNYPETKDESVLEPFRQEIEFHMFVQYILYQQFDRLKAYLRRNHITIMGDMPFYVGIDSDDVYYNRECFELYRDGTPHWIAGVPPDYFSATGQRWGNPLYKWDHLRKHDYDFWFDRLHYSEKLYDILRIDHFRAFDTYWKIDSKYDTAMIGEWIENSGYDFFEKFYAKYPNSNIVAEDLGDLRKEVLELRDHFHLHGMRVLEFNFYDKAKSHELCYIGTHDNDSLRHWYVDLTRAEKKKAREFIRKHTGEEDFIDGTIQYALKLPSEYVILSAVDIIHDRRRINLPGTVGSPNWEYKLRSFRSLSYRLKLLKQRNPKGLRK